ncbi:hypothetical protein HRbin40_00893 [bacterium HR40]|nr:hypothetical protein HRbin40_00893 [bacterium HR40]
MPHGRRATVAAWLMALTLLGAGAALAATTTATLTVTATVRSGCSVDNATLDFGTYTSGQTTDLDSTGSLRLRNCQGSAPIVVELGPGGSGNVSDRRMSSGNNSLRYQLYRDSARSQVWGTGTNAAQFQVLNADTQVQVFGRIPKSQTVPAGTYADTVTITVTF